MLHSCRYPPRRSIQGHKQRNSTALLVELLSSVLLLCPAVLQTDACSERCLHCEPEGMHNSGVQSVLCYIRERDGSWVQVVVLWEFKWAPFFQSALKWSIISFGQSWSVTVSEKQWLLFRLLGPTVLPPVCLQPSTCSAFSCLIYKQALCFCNGVKLEKQTYKHWWYGESRRKACSLFLQTRKNSSERSWE